MGKGFSATKQGETFGQRRSKISPQNAPREWRVKCVLTVEKYSSEFLGIVFFLSVKIGFFTATFGIILYTVYSPLVYIRMLKVLVFITYNPNFNNVSNV